jgi:hypothetical protein
MRAMMAAGVPAGAINPIQASASTSIERRGAPLVGRHFAILG